MNLTKVQVQISCQEVSEDPGEGATSTTRLRGDGKPVKRQGPFKGEGQEQVSEEIQDGAPLFHSLSASSCSPIYLKAQNNGGVDVLHCLFCFAGTDISPTSETHKPSSRQKSRP
jgi:hypothetical protein